ARRPEHCPLQLHPRNFVALICLTPTYRYRWSARTSLSSRRRRHPKPLHHRSQGRRLPRSPPGIERLLCRSSVTKATRLPRGPVTRRALPNLLLRLIETTSL